MTGQRQAYSRGNPRIRFNFRIDSELLDVIRSESDRRGVSVANLISSILDDWKRTVGR